MSTRSSQAYEAIDVCLVTSRDEGGPRAVLEAMATGIPLVTTRVGQASDLVRHGENGWLVDVEDVDGDRGVGRARSRRPLHDELDAVLELGARPRRKPRTEPLRAALARAVARVRRHGAGEVSEWT